MLKLEETIHFYGVAHNALKMRNGFELLDFTTHFPLCSQLTNAICMCLYAHTDLPAADEANQTQKIWKVDETKSIFWSFYCCALANREQKIELDEARRREVNFSALLLHLKAITIKHFTVISDLVIVTCTEAESHFSAFDDKILYAFHMQRIPSAWPAEEWCSGVRHSEFIAIFCVRLRCGYASTHWTVNFIYQIQLALFALQWRNKQQMLPVHGLLRR